MREKKTVRGIISAIFEKGKVDGEVISDMSGYRKLKPISLQRAPKQKPARIPDITHGTLASKISHHYKNRNELE